MSVGPLEILGVKFFGSRPRRFRKPLNRPHRKRQRHLSQADAKPLLSIGEARARRTPIDWKSSDIPKPAFTDRRVLDDFPLEELAKFVDWYRQEWRSEGKR